MKQSCPHCNVAWASFRKNAFPQKPLPTASLPKAALLFSLLLPSVRLMTIIPSCTALPSILHTRRQQRTTLRRWLQHTHCCQRSQSRFCFHFFSFTFLPSFLSSFFFFPSEFTMR